jgi:hypothetical protein
MNNRFRVSSTLPRKLEELSISPDTVLRQASLPKGLFKLERILVTTEEFFALYRGIAGAERRSCYRTEAGDRGARRALRSDKTRGALREVVPGRHRTICAIQATYLSGENPPGGTGRRMRNQVRLVVSARARASLARRRVLRMDSYAGSARYWTAPTSQACRVSTSSRESRNV